MKWLAVARDTTAEGTLIPGVLCLELTLPWRWSCHSAHHDEVVITRLSVCHSCLSHDHLLFASPPHMCAPCKVQPCVRHILLDKVHCQPPEVLCAKHLQEQSGCRPWHFNTGFSFPACYWCRLAFITFYRIILPSYDCVFQLVDSANNLSSWCASKPTTTTTTDVSLWLLSS
jgi:hypothetical protein